MPSQSSLEQHQKLSGLLADYSDGNLFALLQNATPLHVGVGGSSLLLKIDDHAVFVKKIPLTDLERTTDNVLSTANLFHLPLFYQYRLGSSGFGAWRELAAHRQTTEWALAGECTNFPLLYHWRVLESDKPQAMTTQEIDDLNTGVKYWDDSQAVRHRLEALHNASAHLVLFLQYIPQTLHDWLAVELNKDSTSADGAVAHVEREIIAVSAFMRANGFVHFDAHFKNILCDGGLYYGDFGLALSSQFELTEDEIEFLRCHQSYDLAVAAVSLIQSLMLHYYGDGKWIDHLRSFIASATPRPKQITPAIELIIKRYAPIAFVISDFYQQLQEESKSMQYPAVKIERMLAEAAIQGV